MYLFMGLSFREFGLFNGFISDALEDSAARLSLHPRTTPPPKKNPLFTLFPSLGASEKDSPEGDMEHEIAQE